MLKTDFVLSVWAFNVEFFTPCLEQNVFFCVFFARFCHCLIIFFYKHNNKALCNVLQFCCCCFLFIHFIVHNYFTITYCLLIELCCWLKLDRFLMYLFAQYLIDINLACNQKKRMCKRWINVCSLILCCVCVCKCIYFCWAVVASNFFWLMVFSTWTNSYSTLHCFKWGISWSGGPRSWSSTPWSWFFAH